MSLALGLPFVCFVYGAYVWFVRWGRRESEKMADMVALMLTSAPALNVALQTPVEQMSQSSEFSQFAAASSWFSVHPSSQWRQRQIERLSAVEKGLPAEGVPIAPAPSISLSGAATRTQVRLLRFGLGLLVAAVVFGGLRATTWMDILPHTFDSPLGWMTNIAAAVGLMCLLARGCFSSNPNYRRGTITLLAGVSLGVGLFWFGMVGDNGIIRFNSAIVTLSGLLIAFASCLLAGWAFLNGRFGQEVE